MYMYIRMRTCLILCYLDLTYHIGSKNFDKFFVSLILLLHSYIHYVRQEAIQFTIHHKIAALLRRDHHRSHFVLLLFLSSLCVSLCVANLHTMFINTFHFSCQQFDNGLQ